MIHDPRIVEADRQLQADTLDEIRKRVTNIDIFMQRNDAALRDIAKVLTSLTLAHLEHFKKWDEKNCE